MVRSALKKNSANFKSNSWLKMKQKSAPLLKKEKELNTNQTSVHRNAQNSKSKSNKSKIKNVIKQFVRILLITLGALNVVAPIVIYAWPGFMGHMIFQNFIHLPFKNLSNPLDFDLNHTHPFTLQHDDVLLGVWHILPENTHIIPSESLDDHFYLNVPNRTDEKTFIVLYLHGNTNDRSTGHRIELYRLLRSIGYHIIAVDYRGYGDSTGVPTEIDVVRDSLFTYEFIRKTMPWATVYVWGHSLGTGISSNLARVLNDRGKPLTGLILESPFFNIVEEVEYHPFTWAFPYNRFFFKSIERALETIELQFRSDIHLTKVESKILIIHAEDDMVIPVFQAEKLYEKIKTTGKSKNITFNKIPYHHWCGHRNIYSAPNIANLIKSFIV